MSNKYKRKPSAMRGKRSEDSLKPAISAQRQLLSIKYREKTIYTKKEK